MDRTALDRELSRRVRGGVEFAVAGPDDEADLRALLRATPTPGAVSLRFAREPDYFAGENLAGARATTILARRDGRVVCMGRCSRRTLYVDGRRRDVGYLGELRLAPETPGGLRILRDGYEFFAAQEAARPAELYFTSVATTNERARAVLGSGRLGLPRYEPWTELHTFARPVRRRAASAQTNDNSAPDCAELADFLDRQAKLRSLATPWDETTWSALHHGSLSAEDFVVVQRRGRIVAAGALWDQSTWRQTHLAGYSGALRWGRPLCNAWLALRGRPLLPAPGARLKQAAVHPCAVDPAEPGAGTKLLEAMEARAAARGIEWIIASCDARDPLARKLDAAPGTRRYATQLYTVCWPGRTDTVRPNPDSLVRPEVGWL